MAKKFDQLRSKMTPEQRRRADTRFSEFVAELRLSEMRQNVGMTQEEVADALGHGQAAISRMESRGDWLISSLQRYVEALGGELDVRARFPNGDVVRIPLAAGELAARDVESSESG